MKDKIKYRWTVFFLIRAVDDSIEEAKEMIDELKSVRMTQDIAVILCHNIREKKLIYIDQSYEPDRESKQDDLTTVFYELKRANNKKNESKSNLSFVDKMKDFDIRREDHVNDFFRDRILEYHKAKKYILFTWDHGAPFAVFTDSDPIITHVRGVTSMSEVETLNPIRRKKLTVKNIGPENLSRFIFSREFLFIKDELKSQKALKKFKDAFRNDDEEKSSKLKMLTMVELGRAINTAFSGRKIDVVIMMNCFANTFDTGYELRNSVKFLVAPETLIYFNGYNYRSIFNLLSRKKRVTPWEVCSHVITSFRKKDNYPDPQTEAEAKFNVAFFASKLEAYFSMGKVIDAISTNLILHLDEKFDRIKACRDRFRKIKDSSLYHIIDYSTFIKFLEIETNKRWSTSLIKRYRRVLKRLIVKQYVGMNFRQESPDSITSPSGFSVYFPKEFGEYNGEFQRLFQEEISEHAGDFIKKFSWDNFILNYYAKLEQLSR